MWRVSATNTYNVTYCPPPPSPPAGLGPTVPRGRAAQFQVTRLARGVDCAGEPLLPASSIESILRHCPRWPQLGRRRRHGHIEMDMKTLKRRSQRQSRSRTAVRGSGGFPKPACSSAPLHSVLACVAMHTVAM